MRLLGLEISRARPAATAAVATMPAATEKAADQSLYQPAAFADRGWFNIVREPFAGAWQRGRELRRESVLTHAAVYSCIKLIAGDISKCRPRLMEQDERTGVWRETTSAAFSPVLTKPNPWQTRIQFLQQWVISKLSHGNTYALKRRDARGVVTDLYILDPTRTRALVSPDGAVFFGLQRDNLTALQDDSIVPASEVIHDTHLPLFHPLCGVSPLAACGLAARQGLAMAEHSARFFDNQAMPGGILTAPAHIPREVADRIKKFWSERYSGEHVGTVAVLGDGLKYEPMAVTAADAQLIEQMRFTAETVCGCFGVPGYKVGVGAMPKYDNIGALDQQYYSQCLQTLFESIELLLDEGLGLPNVPGRRLGVSFDVMGGLLRMDEGRRVTSAIESLKGMRSPNEVRAMFDLPPVEGGASPYLQQQNYSLAALARRDARPDPFATVAPVLAPANDGAA